MGKVIKIKNSTHARLVKIKEEKKLRSMDAALNLLINEVETWKLGRPRQE